jgi:hypothetical protein
MSINATIMDRKKLTFKLSRTRFIFSGVRKSFSLIRFQFNGTYVTTKIEGIITKKRKNPTENM